MTAAKIHAYEGSLYEILGVSRTANAKAINLAYRMASKHRHPDAGGTDEQFQALKDAHDVLSNPARRQRYDQTGEWEPTEAAKNPLTGAIEALSWALNEVIGVLAKNSIDPKKENLVAAIKLMLEGQRTNLVTRITPLEAKQKALREVGRYFKTEGVNHLEFICEADARNVDGELEPLLAARKNIDEALALLKGYSFEQEVPATASYTATFPTNFVSLVL